MRPGRRRGARAAHRVGDPGGVLASPGPTGDATGSSGPSRRDRDARRSGRPFPSTANRSRPTPRSRPAPRCRSTTGADYIYKQGARGVRRAVRRRDRMDHLQQHGGRASRRWSRARSSPTCSSPRPTTSRRLVQTDLLQPLNHELIPNMANNVWPSFSDPGPWYDQGWQYTVPYMIYTMGRGLSTRPHRRQRSAAQEKGYSCSGTPSTRARSATTTPTATPWAWRCSATATSIPTAATPPSSTGPSEAILQTIVGPLQGKLTINGTYAKLPDGRVLRRPGMVGRHRRRAVVPAEGHRQGRARATGYPDDRQSHDRQRHDRRSPPPRRTRASRTSSSTSSSTRSAATRTS